MLFNEPKLLKFHQTALDDPRWASFSALQRAEIAEMRSFDVGRGRSKGFSALQRAEIAEIPVSPSQIDQHDASFSALQRAEIAEMSASCR